MDKLKQWVALCVLGCLAVLAGGWFLLVGPERTEAADLRVQTATAQSGNESLRTQLAVLKAQAKDLPQQQAKLAAVAAKLPDDPALPSLVRALDSASGEAGVDLVSIAPGPAAPVVAAAAAVPAAPAPGAAPPPAGAPAAASAGAPATSAAAPPAGDGVLQAVPLQINVVGGYFQVQQFVSDLERLSRALRITALSLAPGTSPAAGAGATASTDDGRSLSATLTAEVFLISGLRPVPAPAAAPGAGPVGPTAGPAAAAGPGAGPAAGAVPTAGAGPAAGTVPAK